MSVAHDLSYLARDYPAFRQLILDHLATELGGHVPDDIASQEIALVEVLAYVADYLSYYQDAVATEAYLATARLRVSVARHARLLGYPIGEGCSARAWVQLETTADAMTVAAGTMLVTRIDSVASPRTTAALATDDRDVFETMHDVMLARRRNRVPLKHRLRAHDTSAELVEDAGFAAGDVVILQAEEGWSHAVRLVAAYGATIVWHDDDAVPLDVPADAAWTVLGNIVLADHGRSVRRHLPAGVVGVSGEIEVVCPDLTYGTPYDHADASTRSAGAACLQDPQAAEPRLWLAETIEGPDAAGPPRPRWSGRRCLLSIRPGERSFAVEPIDGTRAWLRFGDDSGMRRPSPDWAWRLDYRTGRGERGNVGAGAIAHIVHDDARIVAVRNPLPAVGGRDPDTIDQARAAAVVPHGPGDRCVTDDDYAAAARRCAGVTNAVATRDGAAVTLAIARDGSRVVDPSFAERVIDQLAPRQLIGDRVRIVGAVP